MIHIAPSILAADFCHLGEEIERVSTADWLHLDVMDGMFVPNIALGLPEVESIRKHTSMFLDTHLMVQKPERFIDAFAKAGSDLLSVHLEADYPSNIHAALDRMGKVGVKKGIALRPITAAEAVIPYLKRGIDLIVIMTVEPGQGGQSFLLDQLPKIRAVHRYAEWYCPACRLEVDGGINLQTAKKCMEAGADILVAGSAIYHSPDPAETIAAFRELN